MNNAELMKRIVYGVAVGDALGFPWQFAGRESRKLRPVTDMGVSVDASGQVHPAREEEIGLWSDDTSLTLCLAESLARGYDLADQAQRFVQWYYEGYLSARDQAFDVGGQTSKAIRVLKDILASGEHERLRDLLSEPAEDANGNGALMRILPLLIHIRDLEIGEQLRVVAEASALTHPHIRSVLCCLWYLKYAEKLIDGVDKFEAARHTQSEIRELIDSTACSTRDCAELRRLLEKDLSQGSTDPEQSHCADYISSGGYVVHTLEAAMYCLLNTSDYRQCVLAATNLGDDTDTVAAVAGGLAALLYGYESIPPEWIKSLKKPELLERIAGLYI
ncbi:MAG: ADP-ribosylglycohydrolase family protein [Candidatus Syntrophosphaera sp.]|nr:ADP-ribosylglycohydrolase family protein [Candidatus Syntrophosphaera sp.]